MKVLKRCSSDLVLTPSYLEFLIWGVGGDT